MLTGVAANPKLLFDRREILLPPVPLNIESKLQFRIINDGYENLNIEERVLDELGNINIRIHFPEGKNIGLTKNRVKVDAIFSSAKPISFTTKLEFNDDSGHFY